MVFETREISRTFGSIHANDKLTISIVPGEVLGILGENGAGKSTLLSILAGMIQPNSGEIVIDGASTRFESPLDARLAGVAIVYQHFSLVPTFTVREQLRLAGWHSSELPDLIRDRFTGDELIEEISLGERQLVEIAKALVSRPRVLLLDEPTSILTRAEIAHLFDIVRGLSGQGTSVVFVTHKLGEAMEVCDRIVVLRQGKAVGTIDRPGEGWQSDSESELLRLMFDQASDAQFDNDQPGLDTESTPVSVNRAESRCLFRLKGIESDPGHGVRALHGIDLDVDIGEIVAIVGVDGQGQRELAEVCSGYRAARGSIILDDHVLLPGDMTSFRGAGITYLTDDRIGEGAVADFIIEDNLIVKRQREWPFSKRGLLRRSSIRTHAHTQIERWHIDPPEPTRRIRTLSGGNIQKVLLAREFALATSLLVANRPTQGLDARTQALVWESMKQFVSAERGVLVFTTDLDEAFDNADRIAVIVDGRVSPAQRTSPRIRPQLERMMVAGW